jgi:mono/diheme cytochrome c family protein
MLLLAESCVYFDLDQGESFFAHLDVSENQLIMENRSETYMNSNVSNATLGLALVLGFGGGALAGSDAVVSDQMSRSGFVLENGLAIPSFDPVKGRKLFATKGCVVCHSVNGIGGQDAPSLEHDTMEHPMNAFDFAARMWRGAGAMIMMQEDELEGQIELDGDELAAIIAFIHDEEEQLKFTEEDVPHDMRHFMMPDFVEQTDHEIMHAPLDGGAHD